ncbi:MAG: c-type cytochrome, partial [Deltaproteobacteria bacterium]|nr:c-type cytochrome [Deltaproteobacteria bacterium]
RNGKRLFLEKGCVKCHPRPGTPREAFSGGIVGSFTQIAGRMLNHAMWSDPNRPEMPLTPEEMSDLVSYIYFLSYSGKPGNPGAGERLFVEKKCVDCHALNGRGGTAASDLGSTSNLKTPMKLLSGMWNSAPEKMKEEMIEAGVEWPEFQGKELTDLFAYILSQTK